MCCFHIQQMVWHVQNASYARVHIKEGKINIHLLYTVTFKFDQGSSYSLGKVLSAFSLGLAFASQLHALNYPSSPLFKAESFSQLHTLFQAYNTLHDLCSLQQESSALPPEHPSLRNHSGLERLLMGKESFSCLHKELDLTFKTVRTHKMNHGRNPNHGQVWGRITGIMVLEGLRQEGLKFAMALKQ